MTKSLEERFWAKVTKTESCWLWTGSKTYGYGTFYYQGRRRRATAVSLILHGHDFQFGRGLVVCHKCDNPPCVNPDHLFIGTMYDNTHDCIKKGRFPFREKGVPNLNSPIRREVSAFSKSNSTLIGKFPSISEAARHFGVSLILVQKDCYNITKWEKSRSTARNFPKRDFYFRFSEALQPKADEGER